MQNEQFKGSVENEPFDTFNDVDMSKIITDEEYMLEELIQIIDKERQEKWDLQLSIDKYFSYANKWNIAVLIKKKNDIMKQGLIFYRIYDFLKKYSKIEIVMHNRINVYIIKNNLDAKIFDLK